jgi:hypothetical protein
MVALIRLLHEKDVFLKYYRKHLAKRLLLGITVSEDAALLSSKEFVINNLLY